MPATRRRCSIAPIHRADKAGPSGQSGPHVNTDAPDIADPFACATSRRIRFILSVGTGHAAWRLFQADPPLILPRGGYRGCQQWLRNIEPLAETRRQRVTDIQATASLRHPRGPRCRRSWPLIGSNLADLIGPNTPIDAVGFSVSGPVATHFHAQRLALPGRAGQRSCRQGACRVDAKRIARAISMRCGRSYGTACYSGSNKPWPPRPTSCGRGCWRAIAAARPWRARAIGRLNEAAERANSRFLDCLNTIKS